VGTPVALDSPVEIPREQPWRDPVHEPQRTSSPVDHQEEAARAHASEHGLDDRALVGEGEERVERRVVGEVPHHRGGHRGRTEDRERDSAPPKLALDGLAEAEDRELGRAVGGELGETLETSHARHADDVTPRAEPRGSGMEQVDRS